MINHPLRSLSPVTYGDKKINDPNNELPKEILKLKIFRNSDLSE